MSAPLELKATDRQTKAIMPAHSEQVERYTPESIFLGLNTEFDLDPCAPAGNCPSKGWCRVHYTLPHDDGLVKPWHGFVFLNPPWTRGAKRLWVMKLREHGTGIALVRGGVDSAWLHDSRPDGMFFLRGRVKYLRADGEPERPRKGGAVGGFEPSMILAFGAQARDVLKTCTLNGLNMEAR